MDTIAFAIVLLTQILPGERRVDTITISNVDVPYIASRKHQVEENENDIFFSQIITDTAVYYIDHIRKLKAIQPSVKRPLYSEKDNDDLFQFNHSKFFTIDSVQLTLVDSKKSEWSLYRNTFFYTDTTFNNNDSPRIFTFETDILCFEDIPLDMLNTLSAIKDFQFVVDKDNQPISSESGSLVGLVVGARYTGYRFDPSTAAYGKTYSTTYVSAQSIERIKNSLLHDKVKYEAIDNSYRLVSLSSFLN